jgi:hypothetical protein
MTKTETGPQNGHEDTVGGGSAGVIEMPLNSSKTARNATNPRLRMRSMLLKVNLSPTSRDDSKSGWETDSRSKGRRIRKPCWRS